MQKVTKEEAIKLLQDLKAKGYSQEELAVMLGVTQQTIWCWSSKTMPNRVPRKGDYELLKRVLEK